MKGRQITDYIMTASECINVLDTRTYAGNFAIKIDIKKAFDTLEWPFLLDVLRAFGLSNTFVCWVHEILLSARFSVTVNGSSHGFFPCGRGVRQGDPLSPLFLCIAEDVLSRGVNKLIQEGCLSPISSPRGATAPHIFYGDDLIVFCNANLRGLRALKDPFYSIWGSIWSVCEP